jgi:uncharacterized protein YrzB (UPF0473 family)
MDIREQDKSHTHANENQPSCLGDVSGSYVLFEKLIEMICDNSGGTWTKGCSEVLVADEVDVHGLADDIVRYLSENGR